VGYPLDPPTGLTYVISTCARCALLCRYARACPRTAAARRICSRDSRRLRRTLMFILFQSTRKKSCPRTIALAQRSVSRDTIETSSSRSSPLSDFNSRTRDLPARECTLVSLSQDSVIIPCALTSPPRQSLRSRGERRDAAIPSLDGKVIIYEPDLLGGAPAYSHGNRCRYCIHYVAV